MEALHELVKQGKVRVLGASAMYGYQFHNMQLAARDHGWTLFSAMENHYNLLYREDERELIPICRQMGVCSPIIGATRLKYLDKAAGALAIQLKPEDVKYLEECYVPHPVIGAIDKNPEQEVILLDEKSNGTEM